MAQQQLGSIIDPKINDRLTSLEKDTGSIAAVVEQLRLDLAGDRQQAQQREREHDERNREFAALIDSRFKALYSRLDQDRKLPWPFIGISLTFLIAVISAFGWLYGRDLARLETNQVQIQDVVGERIRLSEYQRGRADEHRDRAEDQMRSLKDWNVEVSKTMLRMLERLAALEERTRDGVR